MYGSHLILDLKGCNFDRCNDAEGIYHILNDLPELINMRKIGVPHVVPYRLDKPKEAEGITGVVLIQESHISIHTYPYQGYVFVDIFSCGSFDTDRALRFLFDAFEAKTKEFKVIVRGKDFVRWNS